MDRRLLTLLALLTVPGLTLAFIFAEVFWPRPQVSGARLILLNGLFLSVSASLNTGALTMLLTLGQLWSPEGMDSPVLSALLIPASVVASGVVLLLSGSWVLSGLTLSLWGRHRVCRRGSSAEPRFLSKQGP